MKMTTVAGRIAALALVAGGVGACGSSSSTTSSTTATVTTAASGLSRAALAAKANTICTTAKTQSATIASPANLASDATAAAAYFDKVFPITDAETKEIQALTPASDVAADWQRFVAAQVAADQLLQTLKQKADAKDPTGLKYLARIQPTGQKVSAAATTIGATACA